MKYVDFGNFYRKKKQQRDKGTSTRTTGDSENEKPEIVIPFYPMLKNELKMYRGTSKSKRLGVLRKYEEIIAMSRKN